MAFKIRNPVIWEKRRELKLTPRVDFLRDDGCPVGYVRLVDCPEIQTPVNRISSLIASMTVHLMENDPELGGDVRINNELSRMVDVTPNKLCNHFEFYHSIVRNMLLYGDGNAIVYPQHRSGLLVDMRPFSMPETSIMQHPDGYGYHILYKGKEYKPDEILHFRANPDPDRPWIGTGYRVLLSDVANNLMQAQKTKRRFMEAPQPTLIVAMDALTDELDSAEGRKKLADKYLSETDGGIPWFIPDGLIDVREIKPLSLTDIAINESVTLDKKTAAAIFGVPPYFVGAGDYSKDEYNAFINTIIHPIAKSIQQEMTRKLLISDNWYFRFNHRSLLAYDFQELVNGGGQMVDRAAMDRNEYRDSVGLSPEERYKDLFMLENYLPTDALAYQNKISGYMGGQIPIDGQGGEGIKAQQLTAMTKIIEMVQQGTYSKDAAMLLFEVSFPQIDKETAGKLIEGVNVSTGR